MTESLAVFLRKLAGNLLAAPYPDGVACMVCAQPTNGHWLCGKCQDTLQPIEPTPGILSVYTYEGAAAEAVRLFKFGRRTVLARPLGLMMAVAALQYAEADIIVPVPLHWRRAWQRGYNQSSLLAREIAEHTGWPLELRALRRIRHTVPQSRLKQEQRLVNLKDAFAAAPTVRGRNVLLVDDVTTTGATLAECTIALRAAGAARVTGLTACRTG